jgi:hypothetical protein
MLPMTTARASRLVLVHDDRSPAPQRPERVRHYRLARVRVAELRGPGELHAHLARMYD